MACTVYVEAEKGVQNLSQLTDPTYLAIWLVVTVVLSDSSLSKMWLCNTSNKLRVSKRSIEPRGLLLDGDKLSLSP